VDGVLAASQPITPPVVPPPERETLFPLMIGTVYPYGNGWTGEPVYSFDGMIDDVRIYHRGVSANEAATHAADPPAGLVKTVTDPLGRVMRLDYNPRGLPIKLTYAAGTADEAAVRFEYDGADRLVAEIDELGRRTQHQYDALDRLIQTTLPDPDGAGSQTAPVYAFAYDKNNRLTQETDPLGRITSYAYSDRGELLTVTRPDHDGDGQLTVTSMTYTARAELDTITDPLGRATQYVYDALGRNTRVTLPDPDGAGPLAAPVYSSAYDRMSRLTQTLDPLTNPTDIAYANFGRTITATQADPDGAGAQTRPQSMSEYDANGNPTKTTDALGAVTTYAYDALDRLVKVTQPDPDGAGVQTSPVTQYQYDKAGNLRFETDPLGHVTEYRYDARNRLVKIIAADPDGAGSQTSPVTNFTYDDAGQLISETDPLGNVTTREYDNLGRLTKVTAPDPDGAGPQLASQTTFTYDAVGNLLTVTDSLNHTTTYQYDAHNNRTKIIDAELGETVFTFDDVGNLLTLTDPELNATSWVYDGLDRVIEETNELNATRYFAYNAVGNLTRRTDRNGRVTEYDYDNLHRLTAERWMNGATTVRTLSYGYDANSQLLSASDPAAAYTYAYDNLGRTTGVVHDLAALSFNVELLSEYDAASNRTDLKSLVGGTADFWNEYLYDDLHRLTSVQQHGAAGGATVAEKRVDFAYDAASRWQTITRYKDLSGFELVATSTYAFDNAGRLTDLLHAKGANTLADYGWTYDVGNRVTSFTNGLYSAESATYSYDATDQLTGADRSGTASDETYTYDANGNRTNTGYSTGANNRLQSDGTYNYEYDGEGNRTKRIKLISGSPTGETTEYAWDYRNRLTKITERSSPTGAATKIIEYKYDVFDRRVEKNVDANADGVFDEGTRWITDGSDVVLAFDKNGAVTNRYLHGPAIDQILADENALGEVLWPLSDNQGTVRDIADYNAGTNTTTVINHITYTAFGAIQSQTNPGVTTAYAYTGQEWDADAKQYYYNARWYDANTGLFTSEDPIYDDYRNPYRYITNSPANATDPSGLSPNYIGNFMAALRKNVNDKAFMDYIDALRSTQLPGKDRCAMEVHHRWQQQVDFTPWVMKNVGIDVHEAENLALVPSHIHTQITNRQNEFWAVWQEKTETEKIADTLKALDRNKKWKEEFIEAYRDLVAEIDRDYSKYWIRSTASVDDALKAIQRASQVGDGACDFRTAIASVAKSATGPHKFLGLLFMGVGVGKLALTGTEIAFPSAETQAQFDTLIMWYHNALADWARNGSMSGENVRNVVDSLTAYLIAIGAPDELVGAIGYAGYTGASQLK
jgi:RHS repeat-associated protein